MQGAQRLPGRAEFFDGGVVIAHVTVGVVAGVRRAAAEAPTPGVLPGLVREKAPACCSTDHEPTSRLDRPLARAVAPTMPGIRGRKSSEKRPGVNAIVPKEWDEASNRYVEVQASDASINPFVSDEPVKSVEESTAEMQCLAEKAAKEAEEAQAAVSDGATKQMNKKARKKLEAVAAEKAKEAKRQALYASLARHQVRPEALRKLSSSGELAKLAHKNQRRLEQAAQHGICRAGERERGGRGDDRVQDRSRSRSREPESDDEMDD
jgi:hypothetical protein